MSTRARPPASSTASCGQEPKKSDSSRTRAQCRGVGLGDFADGAYRIGMDLREVGCDLGEHTPLPRVRVASDTTLHWATATVLDRRRDQSHHHRRPGIGRQPGFGNDDEGVSGVVQLRLGSTGQR